MSQPQEKLQILHLKPQSVARKKNEANNTLKPIRALDSVDKTDLSNPSLYINRELSWLEFNQRVLDQAYDENHPLLERIKFLSIVGSNLDEFFMIRVATLLKTIKAKVENVSPDGRTTRELLQTIRSRARELMASQIECWEHYLRPLLSSEDIHFIEPDEYSEAVRHFLTQYFKKEIHPVLTPLAFDPGHPFPFMSNLSLNFAVVVHHDGDIKFARVKIPDMLPRFIEIPANLVGHGGLNYVFIEDVIKKNIELLFPQTEVVELYLFRVIRDADLVVEEDEADDLLESVDKSLNELRHGAVAQLLVEEAMPRQILDILAENFEVTDDIITRTHARMGFDDWGSMLKIPRPSLKDTPFSPKVIFNENENDTLFDRIKIKDHLIHQPYESFASVESFLKCAIKDPHVIAIKMTLYRIGPDSPIIDLLISAIVAGKQVAVLVELKARFDEKNNIAWAKRLEAEGAHVVYGLINLKTHGKLCLVIRRENEGIKRYVHMGTGNYNPGTSKMYTDLSLFTARENITEEVSEVFNYLTGYSNKKDYSKLLVAPINLRSGIHALIEREMDNVKNGGPGHIILKLNSLADIPTIQLLYKASQTGVKIDLVVRGICCLRPGVAGISENIRVVSIVGRFLEHSRIYYFYNNGVEDIYIGSADLMERNLDRRVEVLCPIQDPFQKEHVKHVILENILKDNTKSYHLNSDGTYIGSNTANQGTPLNSQTFFIDYYSGKNLVF